jgi:ubiquinone/menaquinone biosynthesis C-methylase UbiE
LLPGQEGWNSNNHYHDFLLKHVPAGCPGALDIGCGLGEFSRRLAARAERVLGLDLSPEMVKVARGRSADFANLEFQVADVLEWEFPTEGYDCIASIATLHHLPLGLMLAKMKRALRPGGTLLVLDLWAPASARDLVLSALAVPVSLVLRAAHGMPLKEPPEVREAWAEHGRHDIYLTLPQVRRTCASVLPGATVTRHLLWRYSIVWKKPRPHSAPR